VHPHTIAGFLSAWVVAYAAIATFCIWARERRGREAEFFLFGLLCVALAIHAGGVAALHATRSPGAARVILGVADAGRIAGTAFLVHVVMQLVQVRPSTRTLQGIYATAGVFEIANAAGLFHRLDPIGEAPVVLLGFPVVEEVTVSTQPLATVFAVVSAIAGMYALTLLGRATLRGRTALLPSLWGSAALVVALLYDAYFALRGQRAPLCSPYGFAAFVLGVVMSLLLRYAALRNRLEERAVELKQRSAELARSYEELRAAQAEIVRKQQLAAVGELSAVIAHEVRNPLAIITTAVATLRREGLVEDDRQTLLGILDEESSRLNRLVGDLLRYARPVSCERQPVSPREIVERALSLAQTREDVKVHLEEPTPVERILADPMLLRQVFDNLVTNALQAMPEGGALTVTLAATTLDGAQGVEIRIEDTGEGMEPAVRDRAFDPFFTTRAAGTGLGLAIVARIVDAHGGRLRIYSEVGAGTSVHVFLPLSGEPTPGRRSVPPDMAMTRSSSLPPMPVELRKAIVTSRKGT
jgi:signal transduction histidine kinase